MLEGISTLFLLLVLLVFWGFLGWLLLQLCLKPLGKLVSRFWPILVLVLGVLLWGWIGLFVALCLDLLILFLVTPGRARDS